MSSPVLALADAVSALGDAWPDGDLGGCEPGRLASLADLLGQVRRLADAAAVQVAAEVARQSRPELGADSLAKRHGHRNATVMIATTLGTSSAEAAKLVEVATRPRRRHRLLEPPRRRGTRTWAPRSRPAGSAGMPRP